MAVNYSVEEAIMLGWLQRPVRARRAPAREWRAFMAAIVLLTLVSAADVWTTALLSAIPEVQEANPVQALALARFGWPALIVERAAFVVLVALLGWAGRRGQRWRRCSLWRPWAPRWSRTAPTCTYCSIDTPARVPSQPSGAITVSYRQLPSSS
jgi:hypothetical protein